MRFLSAKDVKLPKHKKSSHKGQNGRLLIIGGSEDYVGSLVLAGLAALRSGCDWVTIAAPEKVAWAANCCSPDLITKKLKGSAIGTNHLNELLRFSQKFDVVLIGNGIGLLPQTKKFCQHFIRRCEKPLIIDADALKAISLDDVPYGVMTPHRGELALLLKNSKIQADNSLSPSTLKRIRAKLGDNVLLVKGPTDEIITKDKVFYNNTGNEGMTKAGTGDVLAGLIAGLVAQGVPLKEAAKAGAFINGTVGDLLLRKKGYYSFLASDIAGDIRKLITYTWTYYKKRSSNSRGVRHAKRP
ncbi:MAG TPA: NAD(P)H-hydrate dehydratase [Candidatus Nanoarchaeia archaeon]|nr:NAD(P)H-hydrate dehydratase [Candidatus Nanoarchaeia archaeon]